jgi:hypothetical protein
MMQTQSACYPTLVMIADEHDVDIDASHHDEMTLDWWNQQNPWARWPEVVYVSVVYF